MKKMVSTYLVAALAAVMTPMTRGLFMKHVDWNKLLLGNHTIDGGREPQDMWFEHQRLDHFNPSSTRTWRQRYHFNDEWYGGDGFPVFLYINGENVASASTVVSPSLLINELAQRYGALVVSLEHRFYGKSQPTGDLTTASLQYLTSRQALADLELFIKHFSATQNVPSTAPWITFGGSYPGMLSGFARSKYPSKIQGAVASSAPIWTKVDFFEYLDVVAGGIEYFGGKRCLKTIGDGLQAFHALVGSSKAEDVALLKKLFNPCKLPLANDDDRATIESSVYVNFQNIAQYNGMQEYSLRHMCDDFATKFQGSPLEKLAKFTAEHWDSRKCTGSDWKTENLDLVADTSGAASSDNIYRQWIYQTCAEFGFAQTTAASKSIFGVLKYATVDALYTKLCKDAYGITDSEARTKATRDFYGSLDIDVSNVVWATGSIDPWSALAFTNTTKPVNAKSEVVYIEGTSHCADMYASSYNMSPSWVHDAIDKNVLSYIYPFKK